MVNLSNSTKALTFIAEVGMNHNGNFGLLFEMIRQAAWAGADIVKFQLGWRCGPGEINRLTEKEVELIIQCADYHDITPAFSVISDEAFELLKPFDFAIYKIASRTVVDNPSLVEKVLSLGKQTIISLGMYEGDEVPFGNAQNINYLWCKSEYPVYPWRLGGLPKNFVREGLSGYSDHSIGIEIPLLAISRGASIIEKHFTLDKSDNSIRDHCLSATPDEFRVLTSIGRSIRSALDHGV